MNIVSEDENRVVVIRTYRLPSHRVRHGPRKMSKRQPGHHHRSTSKVYNHLDSLEVQPKSKGEETSPPSSILHPQTTTKKTSSVTGILIRFLTRIRESERRTTERERDKTHCWVLETRLTTYRCSALSPHQAPLATRPALLHQAQTREVQAQAGTTVRSG